MSRKRMLPINGKDYTNAVKMWCVSHKHGVSEFYRLILNSSSTTPGNIVARNTIAPQMAEKIKAITGIDWRDYLNKPDQIQFEYAKPATTPAKDEDKADYLELIADCLTEITAELKERNKNAFHFTANETVFITRVLEDTEYVKWCLEHKVDVQRLRHESK